MASTKIDELQLKIGSDASDAIKQLGSLSNALEKAAGAASKLASATGSMNSFTDSVSKIAGADFDTAVGNLRRLNRALKNIKDKDVTVSVNVSGAQGLGNLTSAGKSTSKALSSLGGSDSTFGSAIGSASNVAVSGLKRILNASLSLGGKGASALGAFMGKVGLIPTASSGIDRTAISFGNLLRAVLPFLSIRSAFDWLKDSIKTGSSLVEIENVIDTAFGDLKKGYEDISGYVYRWSKDTMDAFGVSELAAKQYAGRLMSMFNSSGFDITEGMRDSAAKMSTDLIERAGDIASFYDISVDEAMQKIQSGLAGMTRPLRSLGVNMSVANLQAFALSQGINAAWKEMDQATQMALRYNYILNATQYAQGDFQRTSGTFANQLRLLSLNFQVLGSTIGQGLISAIAPAISWLNALIRRIIAAANVFRAFMFTLFGKTIGASKGVANDLADYLDDAAGSIGDVGGGAGDASDGLGKAGKAAKELKKQLTVLPFDELNQLAKNTDAASSGGSGGGGGGGGGGAGGLGDLGLTDLGEINIDDSPVIQAINRWAARIREAFEKKQWSNLGRIVAEGINAGFKYIYDILDWNKIRPKVVDGFIVPFQKAFNSMMRWIDWKLIGKTFARGLNDITYILRAWITGFEWRNYGTYFATGLNSMINDIDADVLGRLIADKFKMAWDFFGGWVRKFNFANLGSQIEKLVLGALDELDFEDMGESLGLFVTGIANTISAFLRDGEVRKEVTEAFTDFINGFLKGFNAKDVKEALDLVSKTIIGVLGDTIRGVDKSELASAFKTVLEGLPWGTIFGGLGLIVGGKLAAQFFGKAFMSRSSAILTSQLPNLFGTGASLGGAATSATASTGASAGAGAASGALGVSGITASSLAITGTAILGGVALSAIIGKLMGVKPLKQDTEKNFNGFKDTGTPAMPSQTQIAKEVRSAPQKSNTTQNTVTTVMKGVMDSSFKSLQDGVIQLGKNPTFTKTMYGKDGGRFVEFVNYMHDTGSYSQNKLMKATDKGNFVDYTNRQRDIGSYLANKSIKATDKGNLVLYHGYQIDKGSYPTTKQYSATDKGKFVLYRQYQTDKGHYAAYKWQYGVDKSKFALFRSYQVDQGHYNSEKWFYGKDKNDFVYLTGEYKNIKDKTVTLTVDVKSAVDEVVADIAGAASKTLASIRLIKHAKGGLFTGATHVFGEAGDEAAIPLERKSTMRKIGNAIANAGGMSASSSDDIADAIAIRVLPAMAEIVNRANQRPVNVNATLYTENNEVLARAVNRGNRSIDKRYNPIAQYSY